MMFWCGSRTEALVSAVLAISAFQEIVSIRLDLNRKLLYEKPESLPNSTPSAFLELQVPDHGDQCDATRFLPSKWLRNFADSGTFIGRGSFSQVFKILLTVGADPRHDFDMVVKQGNPGEMFLNEGRAFQDPRFVHPYLVKTFDYETENGRGYLLMEAAPFGSLLDHGEQFFGRPKMWAPLMLRLLVALEHLHGNNLVHGDLKADQVVFEDAARRKAKLADFGSCGLNGGDKDIKTAFSLVAPELLHDEERWSTNDMWQIGLLFHWLTHNGELPAPLEKLVGANFNASYVPNILRFIKGLKAIRIQSLYKSVQSSILSEAAHAALDNLLSGLLNVDANDRLTVNAKDRSNGKHALPYAKAFAREIGLNEEEINDIVSPNTKKFFVPFPQNAWNACKKVMSQCNKCRGFPVKVLRNGLPEETMRAICAND